MPRDFAGRHQAHKPRSKGKSRKRPAKPRRASPQGRVIFHGPSFSSGAIVGAAIVIIAAYAPEILGDRQVQAATTEVKAAPEIKFEFPDLLKESEVKADPDTYRVEAQKVAPPTSGYFLQAAAFRNKSDAEQLRALLLLEDLPAFTKVSRSAAGTTWHTVAVGPFSRKVLADRAVTRLREQNLNPMWLNNHN